MRRPTRVDDIWVSMILGLMALKKFFDNKVVFNALLDYYNKYQYRFEFKSIGARNNALKLLERNGFDYDLVEDLKGYVVDLPKSTKYAPILKNSVSFRRRQMGGYS